jgi:hypothetical protein
MSITWLCPCTGTDVQVVAINQFASDTQAELEAVRSAAVAAGATAAVICNHHGLGGAGGWGLEGWWGVAGCCSSGRVTKDPACSSLGWLLHVSRGAQR